MTRLVSASSWLWIGLVFAAYLYQFRDIVGPVLSVLGLS
jgi:hypothetical protein